MRRRSIFPDDPSLKGMDEVINESDTRLGRLIQQIRDLKQSLILTAEDENDDYKASDHPSAEKEIMHSITKKIEMNDTLIETRNASLSKTLQILRDKTNEFRSISITETMKDISQQESILKKEQIRLEKEISDLNQQIQNQRQRMNSICSEQNNVIDECTAIVNYDKVKIPPLKKRVSFYKQIVNIDWSDDTRQAADQILHHSSVDIDPITVIKGVVFSSDGTQMYPFDFDLNALEKENMSSIRDTFWRYADR